MRSAKETFELRLKKLNTERQKEIMGTGKFDLWKDQGVDPRSMVYLKPNQIWGPAPAIRTIDNIRQSIYKPSTLPNLIVKDNGKMYINANIAIIPKEKFNEYVLNPEKDKNKALAFEKSLGYNLTNVDLLIENVQKFEATEKPDKGFGRRFEVIMKLTGVNDKEANVLTAWIEEFVSEKIRLSSAYITRKKPK